MTINNKYQPLYVASDSTITSIANASSNLQFCEVNNSINTISTPTLINQNITEDLNLSSYDGNSINPIIQINNTHQHVNITSNLNVASNVNITSNLNVTSNVNITSNLNVDKDINTKNISIVDNAFQNFYSGIRRKDYALANHSKTTLAHQLLLYAEASYLHGKEIYLRAVPNTSADKEDKWNEFRINSSGCFINCNLSIGGLTGNPRKTTWPTASNYPLEVYKPDVTNGPDTNNLILKYSSPVTWESFGTGTSKFSAKFHGNILLGDAARLFYYSDQRIKTNISNIPTNTSLEIIKSINCKYYKYIDKTHNTNVQIIGFIAQEVKNVLPSAVTYNTDFIPDIYKMINCIWNNTTMTCDILKNVSGIKYKFYVSNNSDGSDETEKIIVANSDDTFTFEQKYNNVFCFGKQVDDYHILNESYIYKLHHGAIQEIDTIQQEHNTKILNLENENITLKSKNELLKTQVSELTNIINKLKTANSFEEFKQFL